MTATRIAYILARYPSRSETFIHREIEAVRRHGIEVDVYALKVGEGSGTVGEATRRGVISLTEKCTSLLWAAARPAKLARAVAAITREGINDPIRLVKSLRNLAVSAAFARRIKKSGARGIHAHFSDEPATIARTISFLITIPYTFSIHAHDIFVDKPGLSDRIRYARAVAACTQAAADRAKELAAPELRGKIHLVRHGIEQLPGEDQPEADREPVVLMVGRLVEKKGVPVLLRAVKQLLDSGREVRCVVLGEGEERATIEHAIADLGIEDAVELPGWSTPTDARRWMARAAVLAVPSLVTASGDRDGLPNVILEAAKARLPIVASDVGGIGEFVRNEITGLLIRSEDTDGLTTAIDRIMDDQGLCRRLTEAA